MCFCSRWPGFFLPLRHSNNSLEELCCIISARESEWSVRGNEMCCFEINLETKKCLYLLQMATIGVGVKKPPVSETWYRLRTAHLFTPSPEEGRTCGFTRAFAWGQKIKRRTQSTCLRAADQSQRRVKFPVPIRSVFTQQSLEKCPPA